MSIILVAETGSDVTAEQAKEYGIKIVPMHVCFDGETTDDGTFPVQKIVDFYRLTGRIPTTSGSTPEDFITAFDELHAAHPEAQILYLAYSAITTCSYQSAIIASEGRDYITALDTKQVSVGQANIVVEMAKILRANPDMTMDQAVEKANELIDRARMCFLPENLDFLRAGGRVSNAASMVSRILSLHPCIELIEGKLTATKKYRGKMKKVACQLIEEYSEIYDLDRDHLWIVYTIGLDDEIKEAAKQTAEKCGFKELIWVQAHGVITTHGGPAAMGIAGFSKN